MIMFQYTKITLPVCVSWHVKYISVHSLIFTDNSQYPKEGLGWKTQIIVFFSYSLNRISEIK